MWPYVTFNDLWGHLHLIKVLRLYTVSGLINLYQMDCKLKCDSKKYLYILSLYCLDIKNKD